MKGYLLLISFVIIATAAVDADEEKYTTEYDDMDLDSILKNKRIMDNYMNCFLDKGKCTAAGSEAKKHIYDALGNQCAKCSEKQVSAAKRVLKHLYEKEPGYLKQLTDKYDPDGKYQVEYSELAKKQGYKV